MRALTALCTLLLAGCASTYRLSPDIRSMAAAMTDAQAQNHIGRLLAPSESAGGFCFYEGAAFADGKTGRLAQKGNELRFSAPYVKAKAYNASQAGLGTAVTELDIVAYGHFVLDLARLREIRLVSVGRDNLPCHWKAGRGTLVILKTDNNVAAMINVAEVDRDVLLASLTHLVPAATVLDPVEALIREAFYL